MQCQDPEYSAILEVVHIFSGSLGTIFSRDLHQLLAMILLAIELKGY